MSIRNLKCFKALLDLPIQSNTVYYISVGSYCSGGEQSPYCMHQMIPPFLFNLGPDIKVISWTLDNIDHFPTDTENRIKDYLISKKPSANMHQDLNLKLDCDGFYRHYSIGGNIIFGLHNIMLPGKKTILYAHERQEYEKLTGRTFREDKYKEWMAGHSDNVRLQLSSFISKCAAQGSYVIVANFAKFRSSRERINMRYLSNEKLYENGNYLYLNWLGYSHQKHIKAKDKPAIKYTSANTLLNLNPLELTKVDQVI